MRSGYLTIGTCRCNLLPPISSICPFCCLLQHGTPPWPGVRHRPWTLLHVFCCVSHAEKVLVVNSYHLLHLLCVLAPLDWVYVINICANISRGASIPNTRQLSTFVKYVFKKLCLRVPGVALLFGQLPSFL